LKFEFDIDNPRFLFGETGLAGKECVLGVAVKWHSRDSAQQKIVPAVLFTAEDEYLNHEMELHIEKGKVRGKVTFEILLYLANPGPDQDRLVSGTVFGVLGSAMLLFDGNASMFPILEVN